jgi:tetratricopeptide (TPR) repeat protein
LSEFEIYVDLVLRYSPGSFETATDGVPRFGDQEVADLGAALRELAVQSRRSPPDSGGTLDVAGRRYPLAAIDQLLTIGNGEPRDARPFLRRAALMHVEAIVAYTRAGAVLSVLKHEGIGNVVATVLAGIANDQGFAADWWFAVIGFLTQPIPEAAEMAARQAVKSLPVNGSLEVAAAAVHESMASSRFVDARRSLSPDSWRQGSLSLPKGASPISLPRASSPEAHLRQAENLLRRTLGRAPHPAEAHLRLGRVLTLLGRVSEARGELEEARREANGDRFVIYHAAMFLASLQERMGQTVEAESNYRQALAAAPSAHAPALAWSHLLHESGRPADALQLLTQHLLGRSMSPLDDAEDPWLAYGLGAGRASEQTLAKLQSKVKR